MLMNLKIVDNFLSKEDFESVQSQMFSSCTPWYYNSFITDPEQDEVGKFQFTHTFFRNDEISSELFMNLEPILRKINFSYLIRIKANLGTKTEKPALGGFHSDYENCKTAIFYVNSNNGYTLFEDGTKIDSIENRFVEFDSNLEHSGVSQTDTQVRCVINFNYLP